MMERLFYSPTQPNSSSSSVYFSLYHSLLNDLEKPTRVTQSYTKKHPVRKIIQMNYVWQRSCIHPSHATTPVFVSTPHSTSLLWTTVMQKLQFTAFRKEAEESWILFGKNFPLRSLLNSNLPLLLTRRNVWNTFTLEGLRGLNGSPSRSSRFLPVFLGQFLWKFWAWLTNLSSGCSRIVPHGIVMLVVRKIITKQPATTALNEVW